MEKSISNLCNYLIRQHIISADEKELYEYCFIVFISSALFYVGISIIMFHYNCFLLPCIFTITFLLLRSYMGGWHANNMWVCLLISLLLFTVIVNLLINPDISSQEKFIFSSFSVILNALSILLFGMQDHPNRKLTQAEKRLAENRCYKLLIIIAVLMIVLAICKSFDIMFSIALACFAATILLLLTKIQTKGWKQHET